jgi:hypothetical protein
MMNLEEFERKQSWLNRGHTPEFFWRDYGKIMKKIQSRDKHQPECSPCLKEHRVSSDRPIPAAVRRSVSDYKGRGEGRVNALNCSQQSDSRIPLYKYS